MPSCKISERPHPRAAADAICANERNASPRRAWRGLVFLMKRDGLQYSRIYIAAGPSANHIGVLISEIYRHPASKKLCNQLQRVKTSGCKRRQPLARGAQA
jgi:hypothetical protein